MSLVSCKIVSFVIMPAVVPTSMSNIVTASDPSLTNALKEALRTEVNKKASIFEKLSSDERAHFEKMRDQESDFPKHALHIALYKAYHACLVKIKKQYPDYDERRQVHESIKKLTCLVEEIQKEAPIGYPKRKFIKESHFIFGIEQAEIAFIELQKTIERKQPPFLKKLPRNQLWKMFLDADRSPQYGYMYDFSEPGYLGGMFNSLNAAMKLEGPLTVEDVVRLHQIAMKNMWRESLFAIDIFEKMLAMLANSKLSHEEKVKDMSRFLIENSERVRSGKMTKITGSILFKPECGFTNYEVSFLMTPDNATPNGIQELKEKLQKMSSIQLPHVVLEPSNLSGVYVYKSQGNSVERYQFVKKLTECFNQELKLAKTSEKKQRLIVQYVQNLNQFHPFDDGNIRICAFVLLNMLLMRESLSPVIWQNPNILDGYSLDECCMQVQNGQSHFQRLLITDEKVFMKG